MFKDVAGRVPRPALLCTLLVLALASTGSLMVAASAQASAYSCTGYGVGIPWKVGQVSQFCAQTNGRGLHVNTAGAGYSAPVAWAGWLTNTRVKVEFVDTAGTVYSSALSSQQNGGAAVGAWKWVLNASMRRGIVRYTLLSNGATIAVVEQQIKP